MYGLALCLPRVGQPQGLSVPHETPKTHFLFSVSIKIVFDARHERDIANLWGRQSW